MVEEEAFEILAVCTGNICRSPLAAAILQSGFDDIALCRFAVRSAGTHARAGDRATPPR